MISYTFERYTPDEPIPGVLYARTADGLDWYALADTVPAGSAIVFVRGGRVIAACEQAGDPGDMTLRRYFPTIADRVDVFEPGELLTLPSPSDLVTEEGYESAPPPPRSATKLGVVRALRAMGLWGVVKQALAQASEDIQEDWEMATVIFETDPMFQAFVTAGGFSATQIDELFERAR